jgi:hypothetical protein
MRLARQIQLLAVAATFQRNPGLVGGYCIGFRYF